MLLKKSNTQQFTLADAFNFPKLKRGWCLELKYSDLLSFRIWNYFDNALIKSSNEMQLKRLSDYTWL